MPVLLDFESRSRADLKKVGGRLYWEDPSSQALCCVYADTDTGAVGVWTPGQPCPVRPGAVLAAHNAIGFDRFAAHAAWGVPVDYPWIDTSELARRAGLPGALDVLGTRWLDRPKDKAASKMTTALSSVRRPAGKGADAIPADVWRGLDAQTKRRVGRMADLDPDTFARVIAYCASDVEILVYGWPLLESWQAVDAETSRAERRVNERGVGFDSGLARALLEADARIADRVVRDAARALGMSPADVRDVANSPEQFTDFTGAPNAQKQTVAKLAKRGDRIGTIAHVRQALASIARGKLEAGLRRVSADGRLRDTHRYYGAHTGRWSNKGMQLHNMPRPDDRFEGADVDAIADAFNPSEDTDRETIDLLLRATICAQAGRVFVVEDFAGVESRGLAWSCGDFGALDTIASGRDPYKVLAAQIYEVPYESIGKDERRQAGKVGELACGYGGGKNALINMAAGMGIDLVASGIDPQAVVNGWRELHAPAVRLWREIERAFHGAILGRPSAVSCFRFVPAVDGSAVAIILPSGRPIVYEGAHLTQCGGRRGAAYFWNGGSDDKRCKRCGHTHTYGGKLTENVIQALCRDLLANALVRAERAGLNPVMHVHDEIVCEVPADAEDDAKAELHNIMTTLPEWAASFPIGASGFTGKRYRK